MNNLRFNTKVGYSIIGVNEFLYMNKDYGLLDADDENSIYHCAKLTDEGEVHDKDKEFGYIKSVNGIILSNNRIKEDEHIGYAVESISKGINLLDVLVNPSKQ